MRLVFIFTVFILSAHSFVLADGFTKEVNGYHFSRLSGDEISAYDISAFGESWLAPGQLIWGDALTISGEKVVQFSFFEAWNYCHQIGNGARLPRSYDFLMLRKYLGFRNNKNFSYLKIIERDITNLNILNENDNGVVFDKYRAKVLPHLDQLFWTQTAEANYTNLHYVFDGRNGFFDLKNSSNTESKAAVRCVMESK